MSLNNEPLSVMLFQDKCDARRQRHRLSAHPNMESAIYNAHMTDPADEMDVYEKDVERPSVCSESRLVRAWVSSKPTRREQFLDEVNRLVPVSESAGV